MNLPQPLYTASQVRQLDSLAVNEHAIPGLVLMQRAGDAVFRLLMADYVTRGDVVVVCGIGNNGGDGYVVARLLHQHGVAVQVAQLGDVQRIKDDAALALQQMREAGLELQSFAPTLLKKAGVVVDAIFGTGLEREVSGDWAEAIAAMNDCPAPVIAVDIPSGLHADTGCVLGQAVQASHTVSFIGLKIGLFTQDGPDVCGRILFDDLQVPPQIYTQIAPVAKRLTWDNRPHLLTPRRRNVHKGNFGHVLAVGGDLGMPGAISMAAQAAARVGAGLVSVATRTAHAIPLALACPVIMAHAVEQSDAFQALLAKVSVVVLGPGLGQGAWGQMLLQLALQSDLPMVLDADGLNLLAQRRGDRRDNWVLTPHPLEAARLLGVSRAQVQADRRAAAMAIARRYGGICLLKGSGTLVSDGEQTLLVDAGNGAMASGGMGDVLSGIIAGLLAQEPQQFGVDLLGQAALLHAHCADLLTVDGYSRLLASDLLERLPRLMSEI